jgi:hypothetical protein
MFFPDYLVFGNLKFSAAQLTATAATQYQEYDRLHSEVEFRTAIAPALVVLALVMPMGEMRLGVVVAAVLAALVLLMQAAKSKRASYALLASAVYLGYVDPPIVKSVVAELGRLDPKPTSVGAWIGAMVIALNRLGQYAGANSVVEDVAGLDNEFDISQVKEALEGSDYAEEFARRSAQYIAERDLR